MIEPTSELNQTFPISSLLRLRKGFASFIFNHLINLLDCPRSYRPDKAELPIDCPRLQAQQLQKNYVTLIFSHHHQNSVKNSPPKVQKMAVWKPLRLLVGHEVD
jgi:predicted HAD superfamily hydrolase